MKLTGVKLTVDLEIHPHAVSDEMYDEIECLPEFDEYDAANDTAFVYLYLDEPTPSKIETSLDDLRAITGVLI